jgi:uncharacterized protein YndB with AHSA1/START domain
MTSTSETRAVVRFERTISAPPHKVYRAWLEPELIKQWMAPGTTRSRTSRSTSVSAATTGSGKRTRDLMSADSSTRS